MKNFTPKLKFGLRYLKEIICLVGYLTKYNKHWDEHVNRCMTEGGADDFMTRCLPEITAKELMDILVSNGIEFKVKERNGLHI